MKRIISITLMMISLMCVSSFSLSASLKDDIKAAKSQAKELKKEGWKVENATTIEAAFVKIAEKREQGYRELMGSSSGSQKQNTAKTKARNNAINEFAEESGRSIVIARIDTKVDAIGEKEVDDLITGYERDIVKELNNVLPQPTLIIYKIVDNKYEYRIYYLIDSKAIDTIQQTALDKALEESGLASKYGKEISNFIKEGF